MKKMLKFKWIPFFLINIFLILPTYLLIDYDIISKLTTSLNGRAILLESVIYDNENNSMMVNSTSSISLVSGVDLVPNSTSSKDMYNNTINLQKAIDEVSESGGGTVYLPSGTFYFSQGGTAKKGEKYVIRCRNNVSLVGAGTNENDSKKSTILKPYYNNPKSNGGMDMFYFNNYADTGFNTSGKVTTSTRRDVDYTDMDGNVVTLKNQTVYLINADFSGFVIDAEKAMGGIASCGGSYRTDGKGFMINLFKDCDWNNVVVKNTDATGFGVDCPINSTMNNCKAINCGKAATTTNEGASGFGIGTGYSNDESLIITDCVAINNKKFGFFFEHQARFTNNYPATTSKGFVVSNSIAGGNLYDFGGLKAFNVTYENVQSISGKGTYYNSNLKKQNSSSNSCNDYTELKYNSNGSINLNANKLPIYFSLYSVDNYVVNASVDDYIDDVASNKTQISWVVNKGILPSTSSTKFSPNSKVTRFDAIKALWKYSNMPGIITTTTSASDIANYRTKISNIGFNDLNGNEYKNDLDAIVWAYNEGIISKDAKFNPSNNCSRAQFVTMLYRLAGAPNVSGTTPFTDIQQDTWYYNAVVWGYNLGLIRGVSTSQFLPNDDIKRYEIALFLYRYDSLARTKYSITYNLLGGTGNNIVSYTESTLPYTLKKPTKSGYTFIGWTGSNCEKTDSTVTIEKGTTGDLVYTANWKKNVITLSKISIKTKPNKLYYSVGDTVETTGLELKATYSDGSIKTITNGYSVSPSKLTTPGEQTITVMYDGKKTSYKVNVTEAMLSSVSIKKAPAKVSYFVGDTVETTGLELKATYSDGSIKTITSGYSVSPSKLTTPGEQTITVMYDGKKTSYKVKVEEIKITSISIKKVPSQTAYFVGDKFSSKGLVISVSYNNGSIKEIKEGYDISISEGATLNKVGTVKVTVSYSNFRDSFSIDVSKIKSNSLILLSKPKKVTYMIGDMFDSYGLVLEYIDKNGNRTKITSGYTLSIDSNTKLDKEGIIKVTVQYEKKTVDFDIEVLKVKNIIIKDGTIKTEYKLGESFDSANMVLIVEYTNGAREEIKSKYIISGEVDFTSAGDKTITVKYGNCEKDIKVKVIEPSNDILNVDLSKQLEDIDVAENKKMNFIYVLIVIIMPIVITIFFAQHNRRYQKR